MARLLPAVSGLVLALGAAGAQAASDPRTDGAIEAAFRQQLALWLTADARKANTVVCLAVEQTELAQSATDAYLKRFREHAVRRAADCEAWGSGAVERSSGHPAVLVTAAGIEWIASDEAWVTIRHYRSQHSNGSQQYRVVREATRWACLGPMVRGLPAE